MRDEVGMANDEQREWWVSVSFLIRMGIGILAILPLGWYSDRNFSRRKMLVYIGCACLGVSILMKMFLGFIPHETTRLVFYLSSHVFVGFGQAFYQSVFKSTKSIKCFIIFVLQTVKIAPISTIVPKQKKLG